MAISLLGDVRCLLEIAPRLGAAVDESEGTRYIQLSDTLVTEMVTILVQYEFGLRAPNVVDETTLTEEDIIRTVDDLKEVLRRLMYESYGALAWLQGLAQLSDRARAYKINKLREALAAAEACLIPVVPDQTEEVPE
jgi:hypothetical protein